MGKIEDILKACDSGVPISIDIRQRKIKVGKYTYSALKFKREDIEIPTLTIDEVISKAEELYRIYKYSIPTSSNVKRKHHFKAINIDNLTEEQMMLGENRDFAQTKLELWVLLNIIIGNLKWEDMMKYTDTNWYWFSKVDNDFIILKDIVVGNI